MKKLFFICIIGSLVMLFIYSCKDEKKEEVKEQLIGSMKATIGTTLWEAQEPIGKIQNGFLVITGLRLFGNVKQSIVLSANALTAGTYDLNKNPLNGQVTTNTAVYSPNADSTTSNPIKYSYSAYNGSIIVTSTANSRASGTFSFKCANTAADTIQVTAGEFKNIYYMN